MSFVNPTIVQKSANILIISDNSDYCESFKSLFLNESYGVYACQTMDEVMKLEHVNLKTIIVDLSSNTPKMLHIIEFIKQRGSQIPILITSDYPQTETIIAALNAGACDYLIKPFSRRELINRVYTLSSGFNG